MNNLGKTYLCFEGALWSVIKEDKDHIILRHILKPKEVIKRHYHRIANEWIVITHGKFSVEIDGEKEKFDLPYNGTATVIHFPSGAKHSLRALSKMSYFVLRDRKDRTIYCR